MGNLMEKSSLSIYSFLRENMGETVIVYMDGATLQGKLTEIGEDCIKVESAFGCDLTSNVINVSNISAVTRQSHLSKEEAAQHKRKIEQIKKIKDDSLMKED